MKKKVLVIVGSIILLIFGSSMILKLIEKDMIKDLNSKSSFGIDILYQLEDDEWDNYNVLEGFGIDSIYGQDLPPSDGDFDIHDYMQDHPATTYHITSYPTIISDYGYVTALDTTDSNNHVFNLSVGDSVDESMMTSIFKDYHYRLTKHYDHQDIDIYEYKRSKATITIYVEDEMISYIRIRIKVRIIPGIVF